MKSYLPKIAFSLLFYLSFSTFAHAQKSMQELAELNDKKWDKLVKSYKNNSTWIDQLQGLLNKELLAEENSPNSKKIGVLSMQVWDYSVTTSSKVAQTTIYSKNYLTPEGSNLVADHFLEILLPEFQDQFQAKGIALVEPSEFITDEESGKLIHSNIIVEMGKLKILTSYFCKGTAFSIVPNGGVRPVGFIVYYPFGSVGDDFT
ncbi:hypothetical protein [Algoriphagus marincola]|uniref:hypothetical protein n=1 Tax=Algoriphagus marincola TaxID=264027 RepID=UPI00040649C2|nr:hypothetical protein [Algoriphagus marincola]